MKSRLNCEEDSYNGELRLHRLNALFSKQKRRTLRIIEKIRLIILFFSCNLYLKES
jgi:hypothetical protein